MRNLLILLLTLKGVVAYTQDTVGQAYFEQCVIAPVLKHNADIERLSKLYESAKQSKSSDTSTLLLKRKEAVQQCFQVPQGFIVANPSSFYCLSALQMLGEGAAGSPVLLPELERLFGLLDERIKASEDGKAYARLMENYAWSYKLKEASKKIEAGSSSISAQEAKEVLLISLPHKVSLPTSKSFNALIGKKVIMDRTELLNKIKAATLIVNMAYRKKGSANIEVNPASAYVIDPSGIVVTNYHVVKEYSSKDIYTSLSVMTSDGAVYPVVKLLAFSATDDLAILQLETNGDLLASLPLGNAVNDGTLINVLGHPQNNFYAFTSGVVSENTTSKLAGKPCKIMIITAEFTTGSSGGPIVDENGSVVGTVSRKSADGWVKTGIPVSELKKLLVTKDPR